MNKLRTHIVIHESFLLYFTPKGCSQVSGSTMFYEKCFRFRLLKKSNAYEFASSFFLQSASAYTKKFSHFHKNLAASTSSFCADSFIDGPLNKMFYSQAVRPANFGFLDEPHQKCSTPRRLGLLITISLTSHTKGNLPTSEVVIWTDGFVPSPLGAGVQVFMRSRKMLILAALLS